MKKTESLKKEMASSTVTYMIFIGMLVAFICPVLFALSLKLFTIISSFIANLAASGVSGGATGLSIGKPAVSFEDFRLFSILAIIVISVCSSLIIAIIEKGEMRGGLKYVPLFLVSSIVVYFIASTVLSYAFNLQLS